MIQDLSPAARSYILAFADDEHMIGSRHANWIGQGPFLEEDLAFCSIAQDELGHALSLFELLMDPGEVDQFALLREPSAYRSCHLAELECADWDDALVRHWLYDRGEQIRWAALVDSCIPELAELATASEREERFHRHHFELYLTRVTKDADAKRRIEAALGRILPVAPSLWAPPDDEDSAIAEAVVSASSSTLADRWADSVRQDLERFDLGTVTIDGSRSEPTSRRHRSVGFGAFHRQLGEVISLDPSAVW